MYPLQCVLTVFTFICLATSDNLLPHEEECGEADKDLSPKHPWLVHLPLATKSNDVDDNLRCVGVIISKRYVLTSSHCTPSALKRKAHISINDEKPEESTILDIEDIKQSGDLTLLRLSNDLSFTDYIQPICLPINDDSKPQYGFFIATSGWGRQDTNETYSKKRKLGAHLISSDKDCQELTKTEDNIREHICIEHIFGTDCVCDGDEGGPLMFPKELKRHFLAGIITKIPKEKKCSETALIGGTRITNSSISWILENMKP